MKTRYNRELRLRHIATLLAVPFLLLTFDSCQKLGKGEVDPRPQVYFEGASFAITKGETIKIPVKLQKSPSEEVQVEYSIRTANPEAEFEEYTVTPKVLTFTPSRDTDTLYIKNETKQKEARDMIISLKSLPKGYREGLVNYVLVNFLGSSSFFVTFSNETAQLNRSTGITLMLKNDRGYNQRAPKDMTFAIEVDHQRSTAVEGIHFELPKGKEVVIKERDRNASTTIQALKHEEGHTKIVLNLVPATGTHLGQYTTMTIEMKEVDFSGVWHFQKFANEEAFSWFEKPELIITGKEGDKVTITQISPDELMFKFDISGTLNQIVPAKSKGTYVREFSNGSGDFSSPMTVYALEDINVFASDKEQKKRPAQVGLTILKGEGDEPLLHISFFDLEPTGYFKETYSMLNDGTIDFPLLYTAPRYIFKKQ